MDPIVRHAPAGLFEAHEPPCLSLYQPTHRHFPENRQDPIRFGNLLKTLDESLRRKFPARDAQALLKPFHDLAEDREFWNRTLDGLAVLGSADSFRVYRLQRPVAELAVVAGGFHVKPLIRILQSGDRFQVLALNRREVKLYEGNRDSIDEIELAAGVPRTLVDALGDELTEPHMTVASYGMGAGGTPMRHGHNDKQAEIDKDVERYFRLVDRAILEHHSKPSGLPLLLAALPEHHHTFRAVSHNPHLMPAALDIHPDSVGAKDFRDRAWKTVEPRYLAKLGEVTEKFGAARSNGHGSDDPAAVGPALAEGRVATLILEADRVMPGRVDPATGVVSNGELADPEVGDVLDELAEMALRQGGHVVVAPAQRMPTATGVAAIYRY